MNFYRELSRIYEMFFVLVFLQDREDNRPASLSVPYNEAEQTSLEMETLAIIYSL